MCAYRGKKNASYPNAVVFFARLSRGRAARYLRKTKKAKDYSGPTEEKVFLRARKSLSSV